jgi:hypothetical protein
MSFNIEERIQLKTKITIQDQRMRRFNTFPSIINRHLAEIAILPLDFEVQEKLIRLNKTILLQG